MYASLGYRAYWLPGRAAGSGRNIVCEPCESWDTPRHALTLKLGNGNSGVMRRHSDRSRSHFAVVAFGKQAVSQSSYATWAVRWPTSVDVSQISESGYISITWHNVTHTAGLLSVKHRVSSSISRLSSLTLLGTPRLIARRTLTTVRQSILFVGSRSDHFCFSFGARTSWNLKRGNPTQRHSTTSVKVNTLQLFPFSTFSTSSHSCSEISIQTCFISNLEKSVKKLPLL